MAQPGQSPNSDVSNVDGSVNFSGGVNSLKVTTIASEQNPNGLARNELAWLTNGSVRDGGITPRPGWKFKKTLRDGSLPFQGGWMYQPLDGSDPYLVFLIGGIVYRAGVDDDQVININATAFVTNASNGPAVTLSNYSFPPNPPFTMFAIGNMMPVASDIQSRFGLPSSIAIIAAGASAQFPLTAPVPGVTGEVIVFYASYTIVSITYSYVSGSWRATVVIRNVNDVVGYSASRQAFGNPHGNPVVGQLTNTVSPWSNPVFTSPAVGATVSLIYVHPPSPGPPAAHPDFIAGLAVNPGDTLNFILGTARVSNVRTGAFGTTGVFPTVYFRQGNEFLIINAGDYVSLPLFWDGSTLRQSIGINNPAVAPGTPGINELPPGGPMDFYMGRLWYSVGNNFQAGDISGGASGTAAYNFRDAILNVTENPLVLGGDGFRTPSNEGSITALDHNANQDAAMGQGRLFAFTAKGAHGLSVPVTRTNWIAANSQNQPLLVPVQLANGTKSERSVVAVNGDLFYQSPSADIRTLLTALRYFNQWGNIPISANVNRVIQFADPSLLGFGTGIFFDNRLIQSTLPITTPQGVAHQALTVLDFESISTFGDTLQPTWNGMYEGLDVIQLFTGVFTAGERGFAVVRSRVDSSIQLWEITKSDRFDNVDNRIQMQIEFPAFTWGNEFSLKQQISAELWIDRLYGEVVFTFEYRPDGESCWQKWHEWKVCSPRNSCENTSPNPCTGLQQVQCYPLIPFGESYRQTMTLPTPPETCSSASGRPSYVNYQCQPRLTVKGFCRIRGLLIHALPKERALYEGKVC